jgi:hypothetical protein
MRLRAFCASLSNPPPGELDDLLLIHRSTLCV